MNILWGVFQATVFVVVNLSLLCRENSKQLALEDEKTEPPVEATPHGTLHDNKTTQFGTYRFSLEIICLC